MHKFPREAKVGENFKKKSSNLSLKKSYGGLYFPQNLDKSKFYNLVRTFQKTTMVAEKDDHLFCEALCDHPSLRWVGWDGLAAPSSGFPQYGHRLFILLFRLYRY